MRWERPRSVTADRPIARPARSHTQPGFESELADGLTPGHPSAAPPLIVTPAQAGVQTVFAEVPEKHWIPAFTGMTGIEDQGLAEGMQRRRASWRDL